MKAATYFLFASLSLSLLNLSLSSFSVLPPLAKRLASERPAQHRLERLQQRLDRAKRPQQRVRLARKLKRVQEQHLRQEHFRLTLGLLSLLAGIAAMILLAISFLTSFMAVGSALGTAFVGVGFVLTFVLVAIGLTLAIIALRRYKNDPDLAGDKRLAIAGLVIGILILVPVVISFLSFFRIL